MTVGDDIPCLITPRNLKILVHLVIGLCCFEECFGMGLFKWLAMVLITLMYYTYTALNHKTATLAITTKMGLIYNYPRCWIFTACRARLLPGCTPFVCIDVPHSFQLPSLHLQFFLERESSMAQWSSAL